jgi:hypothetical protein
MKSAQILPVSLSSSLQLHIDGGANCSITNDLMHLLHYKNIKPYYMSSASQDNSIRCTAVGYLPWHSPSGKCILVKCYYSPQATGTIVSPSDTCQHRHKGWLHKISRGR